jgi:hypothetical protein
MRRMRRKQTSPEDELVHVSFAGLGVYRPGVEIAQWKWDVFKQLIPVLEERLRAMKEMHEATKEVLEWADSVVTRAQELSHLDTADPQRIEAMYGVLEMERVLDQLHEELLEFADDEIQERYAAMQAEREELEQIPTDFTHSLRA